MARKALLIGVNKYLIPGADLRGCVNDIKTMRELLREFYGFQDQDIVTLQDADATKLAIEEGYENLLKGAQAGDVLYTHYSGHGSNVPDKSGDEADHRDEILCPTNLDWKDPLTDDWLRHKFDTLPNGVNLTVVMDCCHSGSNTRELRPPDLAEMETRQRFLPCPLDLFAAESGRALRGTVRGARQEYRAAEGDIKDVDIPETLITGCRSDQTSADAYLEGDFRGALTYSLANAIRETRGDLTYLQLHAAASTRLRGEFSQVPQLEGRAATLERNFLAPFK